MVEARIWAKLATASVIMAKKIARTRRLRRPMIAATTIASSMPANAPISTGPQPPPSRVSVIATP